MSPLSRFLLLLILGGALVVSLCGCAKAPVGPPLPSSYFTLRATPTVSTGPAEVTFQAVISDSLAVECPIIYWIWGDGSMSKHEATCHGEVPKGWMKKHLYPFRGVYTATLKLASGGRIVREASVDVHIGVAGE